MENYTDGLEYTLINNDTEYSVSQGTAGHETALAAISTETDAAIIIPESWEGKKVTSIGEFGYCHSLVSITIPDSIKSIDIYAFIDCNSLVSITIPDGVTSIKASTFSGCSSLTSITIPDSVTSIGDNAFRECSSLESLTIPDSVTSIGDFAFYECSSLKVINMKPSTAPLAPEFDFYHHLPHVCTVHIPSGAKGYDVLPWTDTIFAKSIVKDL